MDALTRRRFLIASGVTGAVALAGGATAIGLHELLAKAPDDARPEAGADEPKLVLVTLYGGNDGLNTVIPYADPAYHSARPELAYAPETVLHLDDELGLNPKMTGLKRVWDAKRLAIVRGVQYPKPDHSHFRSMDIWQSASPAGAADTGWIGRWLDGTNAPIETAVSFEPTLPPLLVGRSRVGACVNYRELTLPDWFEPDVISALGRVQPGEPPLQARAAASFADLIGMAQEIRDADQVTASPDDDTRAGGTATGGSSALSAQLALVARCITAGVPTRVYSVSLGGFDTHADEKAGQELLLGQLDQALTEFYDKMAASPAGHKVTVVVYSEFGRRVRANASDGTDHGTAGPLFVLGSSVAGGFYGEQPSLTDLDDGDLKATTDFRDVFGTVLASVLGAEPERYLNGYQPRTMPLIVPG
ncbi:DUF1501 domain-containing protein [Actinoplanes sp. CA-030573]|uniref:DUF1501 domain-containing protein n=1 Tax=Actinoplanes sp. CA-030573 TaxID=3239898 RepID=UPI003D915D61